MIIAVYGCMAQRVGEILMKRLPAVHLMCGPRNLGRFRRTGEDPEDRQEEMYAR